MNVTFKLLFASMLFLAAISLGTSAHAETGGGENTDSTEANVESSTQNTPYVTWTRWDGGTIAWQSLGGVLGGGGGLFIGAFISAGLACSSDDAGDFCGLGGAIIGGTFGLGLGTSVGIQLAGSASGGDGKYLGTLAGTVAGGTVGAIVAVSLADQDTTVASVAAFSTFTAATLGGGILGYHLTASTEVTGLSLAPTDGGATVGIAGRF